LANNGSLLLENKGKVQQLLEVLRGRRRVVILTHNNPDPDSIASAFALKTLLSQTTKIRSVIAYAGRVARPENLEMIRLLGIDLKPFRSLKSVSERAIVLVDVQPGGRNTALSPRARPAAVIDHHNLRKASLQCPFHDIRTQYGSCSAILTEYVQETGVSINRKLATALYYGIKTDTSDYARDILSADIKAMQFLFPSVSLRVLNRIENPRLPREFYITFSRSVENTWIFRDAVVSVLREEVKPDFAAQMADTLVRMVGIRWAFVCGPSGPDCIFSLRVTARGLNAGNLAQRVAGRVGSGGGHMHSAGGSVPLAALENAGQEGPGWQLVRKFLKAIRRDQVQPAPLMIPTDRPDSKEEK